MSLSYFILFEPDWFAEYGSELVTIADNTISEVRVQADLNEASIASDAATDKATLESSGVTYESDINAVIASEISTATTALNAHQVNAITQATTMASNGDIIYALRDMNKSICNAIGKAVSKQTEFIANAIAALMVSNANNEKLINNTLADLISKKSGLDVFYNIFDNTNTDEQKISQSLAASGGGITGTTPGVSGGQKYLSLILEAQTGEDQNNDGFLYGYDYIYHVDVVPLILQNVIQLRDTTLIVQTPPTVLVDPITDIGYIKLPSILKDNPFQVLINEFNDNVDYDGDTWVYGHDYMKHEDNVPEGLDGIKRPSNQMIMSRLVENDTNPGAASTANINSQMTITFNTLSYEGNDYSIEIYNANRANDLLKVELFDTRIIVQLGGKGFDGLTPLSTVDDVVNALNSNVDISAVVTAVDLVSIPNTAIPPLDNSSYPDANTIDRTYLVGGIDTNKELVTGNDLDATSVLFSKEARWRIDFDGDGLRYGVEYIYKNDLIPVGHLLKEIHVKNDIELQNLDIAGGNANLISDQPSVQQSFATKQGLTPSGGNFVIESTPRNGTALSDALTMDDPIIINTAPPVGLALDLALYQLLLENRTKVDQDGDGLIFGVDWIYSDTPPTEFTDVVYDDTENPVIYYDNVTPMTPTIYQDIRESFDETTSHPDGLIYGKHYIFTPAHVPAHLAGIPAQDPINTLMYDQAPEINGRADPVLIELMREHLSKMDRDGDGRIYGIDWVYKSSVVPDALTYINAESPNTVIINTLSPVSDVEWALLQEAYGGGDYNGDGLIYNTDYKFRSGTVPALFADITPNVNALDYGFNGSYDIDFRFITLLREFAETSDFNGDGYIYGVDYVFDVPVRPIEIDHITTGSNVVTAAPNINGTYIP